MANLKKYNITTCRTYQSNGEEKKSWPQVGTLIYFPASDRGPEGYKIELNMFPGTQFFIFPQEAKNAPRTDAEPTHEVDAVSGAVRPVAKGVASGAKRQNTAVIAPGGARSSADQIEYPTDDIDPNSIPF